MASAAPSARHALLPTLASHVVAWLARSSIARLVVIWVLLAAVTGSTTTNFFTTGNFLNVGREISITGVAAIGLTIAIIGGSIDLAFPVVISIAAIALAQLDERGLPPLVSIALVLLLGAAIGATNGAVSKLLRINPLLVTLAASTILTGVVFIRTTGQTYELQSGFFATLGRSKVWELPIPLLVFGGVAVFGMVMLKLTVVGQEAYAVGDNERAAELSGIGVLRVRAITLGVGGACAAMAGILLASSGGQAAAGIGDPYLLPVLSAVVLGGATLAGGAGTIGETVLALIILGTITNAMNLLTIGPFTQMIVQGSVLVSALVLYARLGKQRR